MKHAEIVIKVSNIVLPRENRGVKSFFEDFARKTEKVALFICEKQKKLGYNSLSQNTEKPSKVKTIFKNCC